MISWKNSFNHILYKVITFAFTALFSGYSVFGGLGKEPPETPADFEPVLRFTVCSDIHLGSEMEQTNSKRYVSLFEQSYEYSQNHNTYKKLDAVVVCGDFTDEGLEGEYKIFNKITSENVRLETKMLVCMGNHEFIESRNDDSVDPFENYYKYVSENTETHEVINGYHFIGFSYSDNDENFGDKLKWLDSELKKATTENKNKPVFVFQHPHPTLTVYGSVNWGDIGVRSVLEKYPQVVDFSGHSHYASIDPRTVWQGSFTAVGTGALTGLMGNLNYISGDAYSQFDTSSYNIVEVDADGNIRMQVYDCQYDMFFENGDYYFKNPADRKNRIYNWGNMNSLDTAPQFPENSDVVIITSKDNETKLSFPDAVGYNPAESYNVTVSLNGKIIYEQTVLSDYIVAKERNMIVNLGVLEEKGTYKIKIVPSSPYAKQGKALRSEFVIK